MQRMSSAALVVVMALACSAPAGTAQQPMDEGSSSEARKLSSATGTRISASALDDTSGESAGSTDAPRDDAAALDLQAVRAEGAIAIDGSLDDAGWAGATRLDGFSEIMPHEGRPATEATEVWIVYDRAHLYVAFQARAEPGAVRATRGRRDEVFQDDLVTVSIDPRATDEWAYAFGANPYGVQVDMRDHGLNQDPKLDLLYESAGRITEEGYVVELAIPFTSLQATPGDHPWKINFLRVHPRQTRSVSTWAPLTRSNPCTLCQSGTIAGFEEVDGAGSWALLPSLVAGQTSSRDDVGAGLSHGSPQAEPSLGATWRSGDGWSVEGTYNPDFSQVESDVAQIDVNSTLALSHPEKRPFFQEGSELFDTPMRTVYTRSINDPAGALKVRGDVGAWQVGYLGAYDEVSPLFVPLRERTLVAEGGASRSHVLRAKRSLGEGSSVGALLTDRSYEGGARGTTFGLDGVQRFAGAYRLGYQVMGSLTEEAEEGAFAGSGETFSHGGEAYTAAHDGETFSGYGGRFALERSGRHSRIGLSYAFATPTLQAANGFLRNNDYRDLELDAGLRFQPEDGLLDDISPSLEIGREWTHGGEGQRTYVEPRFQVMTRGQTAVALAHYHADETFRSVDFEGMDKTTLAVQSRFSERVGVTAQVGYGDEVIRNAADPVLGTELTAVGWLTLKPTSQLVVEPRVVFARMRAADSGEEVYSGAISRLNVSYQLDRELSVRLTGQHDSFRDRFEVDPLITYQLSPFSMFYIGATHDLRQVGERGEWGLSERQLFMKFQYLVQG